MSERLMSFEEFRVSESMAEVDEASAVALLRPGAVNLAGWPEWPNVAMSGQQRLMSFEEFRASKSMGEVDEAAAVALLQPGALDVSGWVEWPESTKKA